MDQEQTQANMGNTYHLRLQGIIKTPSLDWSGGISIIPLEQRGALLVSFYIDLASLCNFLDQLQNLDLNIEPIDLAERSNPEMVEWANSYPGASQVEGAPGSLLQIVQRFPAEEYHG
jgi:hypothetical protein